MKKKLVMAMLLTVCLLLSACSGNEAVNLTSNEKQQQSTYEGTLDIGATFYSNGRYDYVYGGIVNDSIVINAYRHQPEKASNLAFYIPISRTDAVALPYNEATKITLKKVDKIKGTADITLTTSKTQ